MVERNTRKTLVGKVKSDKMEKTVVVEVERIKRHPLYGKQVKVRKTYKAHDESNQCHIGDKVEIMETRPLSKEKRWRVTRIIEKAVE